MAAALALAAAVATTLVTIRHFGQTAPVAESVALRTGSVEVAIDADAFAVRLERVYTAPTAGLLRHLVPEGVRVRPGTPVAEIQPDGGGLALPVRAEHSGIVFFQTDGLERELDPAKASGWSPAWFRGLGAPAPRRIQPGRVAAGDPVFKLADNIGEGLVTSAQTGDLPPVLPGASLRLRFPSRDGAPVDARVAEVRREGGESLFYLVPQRTPDGLSGVRRTRLALIFAEFNGKVVPRTAIDVRGGRQGVWVLEAGARRFVPLSVTGGNAAELVVETDLAPGARILRHAPLHMD